ncbi:hypothetical protein [Terrihalobacillus insolitus]|uniref:hypothetical protein n=1 Tax=Terrihalobacillus insolitus TaxID=2950438 RepID=UPI00233FF399|nr:hypothetical protein [Terrihalobacillus insolitus]MDC3413199.1 hypothetical protein [Terrihalobacillus insolitus]
MALKLKKREENLRTYEARYEKTDQQNEEKGIFTAGASYDFWHSEGDSIYDKLYGDEV